MFTPRALVSGAPGAGELVSAEPITLRRHPGTEAWRITCRSTTSTGTPDVVSGAVIAPVGAAAATPTLGYAPGTLGLGDQCAQPRDLDVSDDPGPGEKEWIQRCTTAGYAVAITDHQGLGTPGGHPDDVGRCEGHALLDVLRVAEQLPSGRRASKDLADDCVLDLEAAYAGHEPTEHTTTGRVSPRLLGARPPSAEERP